MRDRMSQVDDLRAAARGTRRVPGYRDRLDRGDPEPTPSLAETVKPVAIRDVDIFPIEIPVSTAEHGAGRDHHFFVVKVVTDVGVRGYSFAGPRSRVLPEVRKLLVGQDLFAIERHLRHGLIQWGGVEHALWDAIGKIAGQPVYKLLGGSSDRVKAYVTCVWKGKLDQSHVPYDEQARMALKLKRAGYRGMKIRAWRPNPMDDVAACGAIKQAVGPDFALMFDRTADRPAGVGQKVWDYQTGLEVARGSAGERRYWLEEPFAREDYLGPARLAAEVDLPITGGEGYRGLGALPGLLDPQDLRHPPAGRERVGRHSDLRPGGRPGPGVRAPLHPPRFDVAPGRRLAPGDPGHRIRVARARADLASSAAGRTMVARPQGPQEQRGVLDPRTA